MKEPRTISKRLPGQMVMTGDPKAPAISQCDLAYLAGFFDGEGCVQIRKRGKRWEAMLRFANTDRPLMIWLAGITGNCLSTRKPAKPGMKRSFEVCLQHVRAERWARLLLPFLRIKAAEVSLLIEFRKSVETNRHHPLSEDTENHRRDLEAVCRGLKRRRF